MRSRARIYSVACDRGRTIEPRPSIGGMQETRDMLALGAGHGSVSDISVILIQQIHQAYERMPRGDLRCGFAIDPASLG